MVGWADPDAIGHGRGATLSEVLFAVRVIFRGGRSSLLFTTMGLACIVVVPPRGSPRPAPTRRRGR